MHETALMQNLISAAEKSLEEHRVKRVNSVALSVGKLSNALPAALSFAFEVMTKGTPLEGAKLIIREIPVLVCCQKCGNEYNPDKFPIICPVCGSVCYKITQGEDIFIESLDCDV